MDNLQKQRDPLSGQGAFHDFNAKYLKAVMDGLRFLDRPVDANTITVAISDFAEFANHVRAAGCEDPLLGILNRFSSYDPAYLEKINASLLLN